MKYPRDNLFLKSKISALRSGWKVYVWRVGKKSNV